MKAPTMFLDGRVALHEGDCLAVLAGMPENCVDSVVTDPPYHLTSIVKRFGSEGATEAKDGVTGAYRRASAGFMGKQWDGGDVAFQPDTWRAVLRVLKPGGYLLAFASTRGFGRMSVAIEDAGFITHPLIDLFCETPDAEKFFDTLSAGQKAGFARLLNHAELGPMLAWAFGQGLPKATRLTSCALDGPFAGIDVDAFRYGGQALKPAVEPIFMGQKPFSEASGTANVHRWGTGAVNIDAARVHAEDARGYEYTVKRTASGATQHATGRTKFDDGTTFTGQTKDGRWPANLLHDGSDAVLAGFPDEAGAGGAASGPSLRGRNTSVARGVFNGLPDGAAPAFHADSGSAARFFYSAKADADDRLGSGHPTVKPVDLMQYLVRLVTPPGGLVLDPFAGTGTTGAAAYREGLRAVLIEREAEHLVDIARRMTLETEGGATRRREAAKAKIARRPELADAGPLFGGTSAVVGGGAPDLRPLRRPGRSIGGLKR
jgi:DNA modification methylase